MRILSLCFLVLFSFGVLAQKDGKVVQKYPSGKKKTEYTLKNGEKEGKETWWYKNGIVKYELLHKKLPENLIIINSFYNNMIFMLFRYTVMILY